MRSFIDIPNYQSIEIQEQSFNWRNWAKSLIIFREEFDQCMKGIMPVELDLGTGNSKRLLSLSELLMGIGRRKFGSRTYGILKLPVFSFHVLKY